MLKQRNITKIIALAVFTGAFFAGCAAGTDQKVNPYPFDTAKIEYELSGNLEGTQTVYIKGDLAAHETQGVKKVEGEEQNIYYLYLDLGESRYEIDLNKKEGKKSMNPLYKELKKLKQNEKIDFLIKVATNTEALESVPTSTGEKEFAGKTCKTYNMSEIGEICFWKGIPLYSKLSLSGGEIQNTMTAVSVETDIEIKDSVFAVPVDVDIIDSASL